MSIKDLMPRWGRGPVRQLGRPSESLRFLEDPWRFSGEPRIRLEDNGKEIVVSAVLPGMGKEDVEVELTEETLTLRGGQSKVEEQRRHGGRRRTEAHRSFYRSFTLPASVHKEQAKAEFKNGTLEIRMPRVKEIEKRRIEIE